MATEINEISVWDENTPVITIGDPDFGTWDNNAPVIDVDESNPNNPSNRRRVTIY